MKREITTKEVKERWDKIAEWYSELIHDGEFPPRKDIVDPVVKDLIIRSKPKIAFDAGCGEGYMSRFMAKNGIKVFGADISKRMIEIAKEKEMSDSYSIEYFVADLEEINKDLYSYNFDLILCHQVLMNVVDLNKVFANFHKLLSDDGRVIISITHPFLLAKNSEWFREEVVDNHHIYLITFWKLTTFFDSMGHSAPMKVLTCHRPLQEYIMAMNNAGFYVTKLLEPQDAIKTVFMPLYMVIEGIRV